MASESRFELIYAAETLDYLDVIERKHHRLIETTIAQQLRHTPEHITRNRKPLEQPGPFGATWELRFGPNDRFRVFYDVNTQEQTVEILAIGVKERHRLLIGKEEYGQ